MLLADHIYPAFERYLKSELRETSEKYVAKFCANKLSDILMIKPIY